jgi:hypothetical protein
LQSLPQGPHNPEPHVLQRAPRSPSEALLSFCKAAQRRTKRKAAQLRRGARVTLGRIDAVDLKHVLGYIQADCRNLHVDGSLMWF